MSADHGHDSHGGGHEAPKSSSGGGILSAFGMVASIADQTTNIFRGTFLGIFDAGGGGGGGHGH